MSRVLTAAAATAVVAGAGVGAFAVVDADTDASRRDEPGRTRGDSNAVVLQQDPTATDAGPNPWAANDCAVLLAALGDDAPSSC